MIREGGRSVDPGMDSQHLHRRRFFALGSSGLLFLPVLAACDDGQQAGEGAAKPDADGGSATGEEKDDEAAAQAADVELLNKGILLEQAAINVYTAAAGLAFIKEDAAVIRIAGQFMGHHEEHRDTLISFVEQFGGTPSDPKSAKTPEIPALVLDESAEPAARKRATLEFARKLERQAAETYHALIVQQLQTEVAKRGAVEILPTESQHVAIYDLVLGVEAPVNAALFSEQS